MLSKICFFLAFASAFVGAYVFSHANFAFSALLLSLFFLGLGMVFVYFGALAWGREDRVASEKAWAVERKQEEEALNLLIRKLYKEGYEFRRGRSVTLFTTEEGVPAIKVETGVDVPDVYLCSDLSLEPVPNSRLRVYKNEIVLFIFFGPLKTNGYYFVKVKA